LSPAQFLGAMKKGPLAPVYLFLGSEAYDRRRCKDALLSVHLTPEERAAGLTHYDLSQTPVAEVIDDARALSLFAAKRLIIAGSAEAAVPKASRAAVPDDDEDEDRGGPGAGSGAGSDVKPLEEYLRDPTPGVVVLFEATRFGLEGDDKKKAERVAKFFSAIRDVVEFAPYAPDEARREAQSIARRLALTVEPSALEMLVEAVGADIARIATELEKLSLLTTGSAGGRAITPEDIQTMVPDARASTIFALVNALGRRDRAKSLSVLDTLCRDGEYLPLALSFLSSQFRQALIAREANLRSSQQIMGHFTKMGVPMWSMRAEQVNQTATKFSRDQLERGLKLIFEADRNLRSARPDDRIVMEQFVVKLMG
jgi:DNA polymerase-3 subunit delta